LGSCRKKMKRVRFWDELFNPDELHLPKFCPNCGKELPPRQAFVRIPFWLDSDRKETKENPYRGIGYDIECPSCDWSGDIIPDDDLTKVHNIVLEERVLYKRKNRPWKIRKRIS